MMVLRFSRENQFREESNMRRGLFLFLVSHWEFLHVCLQVHSYYLLLNVNGTVWFSKCIGKVGPGGCVRGVPRVGSWTPHRPGPHLGLGGAIFERHCRYRAAVSSRLPLECYWGSRLCFCLCVRGHVFFLPCAPLAAGGDRVPAGPERTSPGPFDRGPPSTIAPPTGGNHCIPSLSPLRLFLLY